MCRFQVDFNEEGKWKNGLWMTLRMIVSAGKAQRRGHTFWCIRYYGGSFQTGSETFARPPRCVPAPWFWDRSSTGRRAPWWRSACGLPPAPSAVGCATPATLWTWNSALTYNHKAARPRTHARAEHTDTQRGMLQPRELPLNPSLLS